VLYVRHEVRRLLVPDLREYREMTMHHYELIVAAILAILAVFAILAAGAFASLKPEHDDEGDAT
jgi:hypothetical protein